MIELPITMDQPDGWMEKTGGYAKDMTLRDYFAAKAMSGLLERVRTNTLVIPEKVAEDAYAVADQMLKAGQ